MIEPLPLASSEGSRRSRHLLCRIGGQGTSGRDADVEAVPVDGILAGLPPLDVAVGLVIQIPADGGDAVGQGQSHAGIVGPFAGFQAMRPAAAVSR